jgi:tetratricopeptide (TPR) repeat protein
MTPEMEQLWIMQGQGTDNLRNGNYQQASRIFAVIIRCWPNFVAARVNNALCLVKLGHADEALEHLAIAHNLAPSDPDVHSATAEVYESIGAKDLEILERQNALTDNPDSPFLMNDLGATYREAGQHTEAEIWLLKALRCLDQLEKEFWGVTKEQAKQQIDGQRAKVYWNLASNYMGMHKWAEAVHYWKEAVNLMPNNPYAKELLQTCEAALKRQVS